MRQAALCMLLLLFGCTPVRGIQGDNPGTQARVSPTIGPIRVQIPTQPIPQMTPTPLPVPGGALVGNIAAAVTAAKTWLGTPYLWGGCSKNGVDCSCFVRNVLAVIGINAPRVTTAQIQWATPVSAAAAQPVDLVFFDNTCSNCGPNPTHVGLYLGGGLMIDAGDPVKIEAVYSGHNARYGRPPGL